MNKVKFIGIGLSLAVVVAVVVVAISTFNKPKYIELKQAEDISYITVENSSVNNVYNDPEQIRVIMQQLSKATLTKEESVNDQPSSVSDYTTLKLYEDSEHFTTIYSYEISENWYIEIPYVGIYNVPTDLDITN